MSSAAFKAKLAAFVERAGANQEAVVRKIALELLRSLVLKSPVDTGRFRGNWIVQESLAAQTSESTDKNGGSVIAEGGQQVASFKLGDKLYLVNWLPYGSELERGTSQQAPAGMVRITVAEFQQFVAASVDGIRK